MPLQLMGACGVLHDEDRLCEYDDASSQTDFHMIEEHGRDIAAMAVERRARVGLAVATQRCGERAFVLHLDTAYPVFALRVWHHGLPETPQMFRIEVRDEQGEVHVVVSTNNFQGRHLREHETSRLGRASSAPVTTQFAPVTTREIRYVMNTCSTADTNEATYLHGRNVDDGTTRPMLGRPGHGWIYEVEAFAMLTRRQAWWRLITGT